MTKAKTVGQNSTNSDPSMREFLRTTTYFGLFPMIILMPVWFAFGRSFFGASGWGVFITLPLALIIILPYHIVIAVLAFLGKKVNFSKHSLNLLLSYYFFAIFSQLSFVDGGDTPESVGSALTFTGLPEMLNTGIFILSFFGGILAMIGVIISLTKDLRNRKRQHISNHST